MYFIKTEVMKSEVAVFDSHEKALEAIKLLNDREFPMDKVSILGQAELMDDHIHVQSLDALKTAPGLLGVGAGTVLGLLTGIGAFAIPGFGFLYGAGALVGIIGGFDIGLVSGGLISLLVNVGVQEDEVVQVEQHLKEGKFLVIVNGSTEQIEKAKVILSESGSPFGIE